MSAIPFELHRGDCIEVLRAMPSDSVDSIVTDPPYGLSEHTPEEVTACLVAWVAGQEYKPKGRGFMNHAWDAWVPGPEVWRECMRVLKPGGHLLSFFGTRTYDLGVMALRLSGFEIRDQIGWAYGSGFPKSMDVGKAIDKAAGAQREVVGEGRATRSMSNSGYGANRSERVAEPLQLTAPATEAAEQWDGWGTALKPALEPIVVARKPFRGTVAGNVLQHGTGALHIDACRVGTEVVSTHSRGSNGAFPKRPGETSAEESGRIKDQRSGLDHSERMGRWPANFVHDGSDEVMAVFPDAPGQKADASTDTTRRVGQNVYEGMARGRAGEASADSENTGALGFKMRPGIRREDTGSAARFFYCAKASAADRHEGLPSPGHQFTQGSTLRDAENLAADRKGNFHPTVKPTELMAWLVRLVTPPGGTVLDPFVGSGSTGKACMREGFYFIGVDLDDDGQGNPLGYIEIARARIAFEWHRVRALATVAAQQTDLFNDLPA